jgi:hypothetical protein
MGAATPVPARVLSFAGTSLSAPRLSVGDSNGDGVIDAALAGVADGDGRARVDWFGTPGRSAVTSDVLHGAADLTHADLDGDGRDEIIVVGSGGWQVMGIDDDALHTRSQGAAATPLWRVAAADIDADGRDELALVTVHRGLVDEIPRSTIELVSLELSPAGISLRTLDAFDIDGHVGDLCFAPGEHGPSLVVETGAEEVGGRLHWLSTSDGALREVQSMPTGSERLRVLSLSAVRTDRRTLLSLGDVTGRIRVMEWCDGDLTLRAVAPLSGAGAALSAHLGVRQMWIAPMRPGEPIGWWSPVE